MFTMLLLHWVLLYIQIIEMPQNTQYIVLKDLFLCLNVRLTERDLHLLVSSTNGSNSKVQARSKPGARNVHWVTRAQALGTSSAILPGTLAGNYTGYQAAWPRTGISIWDACVLNGSLTCWAQCQPQYAQVWKCDFFPKG